MRTISGNTITWAKSASSDVVGYRVFQVVDGQRVLVATKAEAESPSLYN